MDYPCYLLADIGGTNLRVALSNDLMTLQSVQTTPTPQNYHDGLKAIAEIVKLLDCSKLDGAIVGLAGTLNIHKNQLVRAPHLPDWVDQPIQQQLSEMLACPFFLENDAALAGLGEACFGAGQDRSIIAYLTISTGVGGARIVNQKIDQSSSGFEPGHQLIQSAGQFKELEDYISGSGLHERYHQDPAQISDPAIWQEVQKYLAIGLANTIAYWSPELIILNGPIVNHLNLEAVKQQLSDFGKQDLLPEIKLAQLGDQAGLWGGMKYLETAILK